MSRKGPLDSPEEIGGACMEGLVAQHLRAWIAYSSGERSLYFWQTKAGLEVDFIVYGQDCFLAIEVKRSRTACSKDVRPLLALCEDYPQAKACLLYGGKERLMVSGVPCVPCEEFLRGLAEFLRIDDSLVEAAAEASLPLAPQADTAEELRAWIESIPAAEKDALLYRLTQEPPAVVQREIVRRVRQTRQHDRPAGHPVGRTVGQLLAAAEQRDQQKRRLAAEKRAHEEARRRSGHARRRNPLPREHGLPLFP